MSPGGLKVHSRMTMQELIGSTDTPSFVIAKRVQRQAVLHRALTCLSSQPNMRCPGLLSSHDWSDHLA